MMRSWIMDNPHLYCAARAASSHYHSRRERYTPQVVPQQVRGMRLFHSNSSRAHNTASPGLVRACYRVIFAWGGRNTRFRVARVLEYTRTLKLARTGQAPSQMSAQLTSAVFSSPTASFSFFSPEHPVHPQLGHPPPSLRCLPSNIRCPRSSASLCSATLGLITTLVGRSSS